MNNNLKSESQNPLNSNEEFDLRIFFKFLGRNKLFISTSSIIFFLLCSFYSLTLKRIWEGQFQIVLNNNEFFSGLDPKVEKILDLKPDNDLKTEVAILESPSVLIPIFDFVVARKIKKDKEYIGKYSAWKSNLDITLKKGTSVLNISYRDTDKELILPALKKISFAYQDYSGKKKRRLQKLTKNYLQDQIVFFKDKSTSSLKKMQDYAIENVLDYPQINSAENEGKQDIFVNRNIDIEKIRIQSAKKIKEIDIRLKNISKTEDSSTLQFIGGVDGSLLKEDYAILKNIERELITERSKYTEDDINIINLLEQRKLTLDYLKDRVTKFLLSEKLEAETLLESTIRPKGVILNYKELIREAARDESTLVDLEDKLRIVELEEARAEDPWELITEPTLKTFPVGPSRIKFPFLGLLTAFFISSIFSFYREKKSGKVFDTEEIIKLLNIPLIENLNVNDLISSSDKIKFLETFFSLNSKNSIVFIYLTDELESRVNTFSSLINNEEEKTIKFFQTNLKNLKKINKNQTFYLIVDMKLLDKKQIYKLTKHLKFLNFELNGIIMIEDT
ncbi:Wzz/FepE/Etk N-terminal domain-containing protein [uncultured Prochlorococcus sp.]|uniref:GumC family protein n=1 Tax=uncultured Prochlorococcus sp. TaxID=159733 RepID=UPI002586B8D0|nr:Wzz/FepE/Etk N-terminal domain-containing protein [uncultured Prochlorococcus sp.]